MSSQIRSHGEALEMTKKKRAGEKHEQTSLFDFHAIVLVKQTGLGLTNLNNFSLSDV